MSVSADAWVNTVYREFGVMQFKLQQQAQKLWYEPSTMFRISIISLILKRLDFKANQ